MGHHVVGVALDTIGERLLVGWRRAPCKTVAQTFELCVLDPSEEAAILALAVDTGVADRSDEASFVTGAVLVADGGGRSPTQSRAA